MELTERQIQYRAYLASPLWKAKRLEALAFHGCKCNRCGEYGTDVHHKTYERVFGNELMEDFEVLCRECHEVEHENQRKPSSTRIRKIHRAAVYKKLTADHKLAIREKFKFLQTDNDLYAAVTCSRPQVARFAGELVGYKLVFGRGMGIKSPGNYTSKLIDNHRLAEGVKSFKRLFVDKSGKIVSTSNQLNRPK
jgi:hypothetical protein